MANTYTSLHYHIIFSTKNREPWLVTDMEQRVWAFIGGIARAHRMTALQVGGVEDHVHALVTAPPTIAPAQIAQYLKGDSSKWIHEEFRSLRNFGWQDGYGGFTVSKSKIPKVIVTLRINGRIIVRKHFSRSTWNFLARMVLNTTNDICGDDFSRRRRDGNFLGISIRGFASRSDEMTLARPKAGRPDAFQKRVA
jgi:REP element-mobilizing transposase RayT